MGRWSGVLVVSLVLASCGASNTADSTTTTSTSSSSTASTTVATTTTTPQADTTPTTGALAEQGPDACKTFRGTSLSLDPGDAFCEDSFIVPVRVEAAADGWLVRDSSNTAILFLRDLDGDGAKDVSVALIAFDSAAEPDLLRVAILDIEGVDAISEPRTKSFGGFEAMEFDVIGQENRPAAGTGSCTQYASPQIGFGSPGYGLVPGPTSQFEYGIAACFKSRVWVIDLGDIAVTAIGVTDPDDRFGELMPIIEDFLENNVTFGSADG